MKVVFASSNHGKIRELETLLKDFQFTFIPQTQLGVNDAEETGLTFVENALIKARHACKCTGLPAIADDSGLAVAALQGAPGIHSARYAGAGSDAQANIQKLLLIMQDIPHHQRQATFHCVLVFMLHANDPTPLISHGVWHGSILQQAQGQGGFGYDPIFFVSSENKSAAELPDHIKHRLSHRGQALRQLIQMLNTERNGSC